MKAIRFILLTCFAVALLAASSAMVGEGLLKHYRLADNPFSNQIGYDP